MLLRKANQQTNRGS